MSAPPAAISKSTDAVDERSRDDVIEEVADGTRLHGGNYSEEFLDRLEPNGNIPKNGSLYRGM